uniref:Uncharacterized protein n=1 Tax=Palpitomonas bilix TaxID=652834 RepID=A0A7S3G0Z6_9EUKA
MEISTANEEGEGGEAGSASTGTAAGSAPNGEEGELTRAGKKRETAQSLARIQQRGEGGEGSPSKRGAIEVKTDLNFDTVPACIASELAPAINSCTQLERLSIRHCPGVSRDDLLGLAGLSSLRHVSIRGMVRVDDLALVHFLKRCGSNLESLDVGLCRQLTKASLLKIGEVCPCLKRVALSGLTNAVDDEVVASLSPLPLEVVHLRACKRVEGKGLEGLKKSTLRQLSLHSVENLTQATLFDFFSSPALGCISSVDLSWLRCVDDTFLLSLSDYLREMRLCLLWGCMTVSDEVMNEIRERADRRGYKCRVFGGNSGQRVDAASIEVDSSYSGEENMMQVGKRLEMEWSLLHT